MKTKRILSFNKYFYFQFINDLSTRIDLEKTLKHAEGLYIQLTNFKNVPANICRIVGLPTPEKSSDDTDYFDEGKGDLSRAASKGNLKDDKTDISKQTSRLQVSDVNKSPSSSNTKDDETIEYLN